MDRSREAACLAVLTIGLLFPSAVGAVDVRGSVRAAEAAKNKTSEAVRAPYWQEWNGFIDPKKASVDYAREVTAVLIGAPEMRDATTVALRDGTLAPTTIVVQHGTTLRIRNEDDFSHELYVEGLKGFDAVATSAGSTRTIQMEQTGVFTIRDRLAPYVRGTLHVVAKLTFAVQPDADGSFVFNDVPPGKYTLKLFRGAEEMTAHEVEIANNKDVVLAPVALESGASAPKTGK